MEPKNNSIIFGIVLGVILLMLIAAAAYYLSTVGDQESINVNTAAVVNSDVDVTTGEGEDTNEENVNDVGGNGQGNVLSGEDNQEGEDVDDESAESETVERVTDEGVTWLAEPQKLDPLPLFKADTTADVYINYKVADLDDGGELIYIAGSGGWWGPGSFVGRLKKEANGTYLLLSKHSEEGLSDSLNSSVRVDTTTEYQSLQYPSTLSVNGLTLTQEWPFFTSNFLFDVSYDGKSPTVRRPQTGTIEEFGETAYGTLYVSVTPLETETKGLALYTKKYVLVLSDTSVVYYTVDKSFVADDNSIVGTFTTAGESFKERMFLRGVISDGCGGPTGDQFPAEIDEDQLTVVGTTLKGEPLYAPKDSYEALLRIVYDEYKVGRNIFDSGVELLSYEDFVTEQPLLIWKDTVGDYHLFRDIEFGPLAECGKPVIYLYPTTTTPVSIRVAADVTVSEPVYDNGWNVVAQPDGTLTTAVGEVVHSLYWEGKGRGVYPAVVVGTVVAREDVEHKISADLATMGLNATETQDFLDFWMPRMPNTPYVRLTWFNTVQMNQLAPLSITPRPQTLLRVFLDFEGQDTPVTTLQSQVLRRTERRGFTVVEWGGLLLGGR